MTRILFVKLGRVDSAYEWIDHTGELELAVEAATEAEIFVAAARALGELLAAHEDEAAATARSGATDPRPLEVEVAVEATDRPALLAEWLAELAFLAETERMIPVRARDVRLDRKRIAATVAGRHGDPPHLVKAVTYHRLEMRRTDEGWRGRVVIDV